jgi:hypothetical protein
MARARTKSTPFDFDNAAPGSPGPDGSPVIDTFVTDSGIPGVETRSAQGLRTFTFPLAAVRRQSVSRVIPPPPEAAPKRQPARVARMLALAHDLQGKLDRGEYPDQATLAAQLGFTRGRLTKLLDLTLLAPDIQEEVLHFEAVDGVEPLAERDLHRIARQLAWADQRRAWAPLLHLCARSGAASAWQSKPQAARYSSGWDSSAASVSSARK